MRLGLPPPPVALGVLVADLVGQVAAKEPDEGRGGDDGQDDEPQLGELELEAEDDGGGVLGRGREGADEDGVEGDDPEHVGEEGGLDGLDDGAPAQVPLEGDREEAEVVLVGAVPVPGVVEAGARLAGAQGEDGPSGCIFVLDQFWGIVGTGDFAYRVRLESAPTVSRGRRRSLQSIRGYQRPR